MLDIVLSWAPSALQLLQPPDNAITLIGTEYQHRNDTRCFPGSLPPSKEHAVHTLEAYLLTVTLTLTFYPCSTGP